MLWLDDATPMEEPPLQLHFSRGPHAPTVDSIKFEHGCRIIYASVPSFCRALKDGRDTRIHKA